MKAPNDSQVLASGSHGEKAIRTMQQLILAAGKPIPPEWSLPHARCGPSQAWIFPPAHTLSHYGSDTPFMN